MTIKISIQDLHKKFGATQALNGVTHTFESGLLHGLIGPEGAGKTTLLGSLWAYLSQHQARYNSLKMIGQ